MVCKVALKNPSLKVLIPYQKHTQTQQLKPQGAHPLSENYSITQG